MDTHKNINEFLEKYKAQKVLYKNFSSVVKNLLEKLLKTHDIKHHIVSCRAKKETSVKNKLEKTKNEDINDLAGCRVTFYTSDNIDRIIPYLRDEFEIIKQEPKYSHNNYNAVHLVIKLKQNRLKLCEYKIFKNLKCEIQLTTVLHHSWSEMAHNIIYKPEKSLLEFSKSSFEKIENLFSKTMKDHIIPAQQNFNFIAKTMERIKQGKQVFDHTFIESILRVKNNNEIYEKLLELLQKIKKFGDQTPKELNITKIINDTLEKSKKLKTTPQKHPFGNLPGKDYFNIADICLDILETLKFIHPKEVFEILIPLGIDQNIKIQKKSLKIVSDMAEYILNHKKNKIYYHLQLFILDKIEKWNNTDLLIHKELILSIAQSLLSPNFEITSFKDYRTMLLHHGAVPANKITKQNRERTISILKKLYLLLTDISDQQKVLKVMEQGTHLPDHKNISELNKIILENTNSIISHYLSILNKADNEILQIIDEHLYWLKKRFPKGLKNLEQLQLIIIKNKKYQMYKTFISWRHPSTMNLDENRIIEERKIKLYKYLKQITQKNFAQWENNILSITKNYEQTDHQGEYYTFDSFFELGKHKPQFTKKLVLKHENKLKPFLLHLLSGIWKSKNPSIAKTLLANWIKQGNHLQICAFIFYKVRETDESLLKKVYKKAKEKHDITTLVNIIRSIEGNFHDNQSGKKIMIDCIKELSKYQDSSWIHYCIPYESSILKTFTQNEWSVVLKNLIYLSNINHQIEYPLSIIAKKHPKMLIDFFYERIKQETKQRHREIIDMITNKYDAIPYQFHTLHNSLSQNPKLVVTEVLKWFEKEEISNYDGASFLQNIFPHFHPELESQLIKLITSKKKDGIKTVLQILYAYQYNNGIFLHNICKEVIKKYPKKYKKDMFQILSQTGAVLGEYGLVENYQNKKNEIQEWKKDKHPAIKNFAIEYEKYLEKAIEYERKIADERIAMRKLKFENLQK